MELAGVKQKIKGIVDEKTTISICEQITKEFIDKIGMIDISELLEQIKNRKVFLIKNHGFEEASFLRDIELCLEKKISFYLFGKFIQLKMSFTCNNCKKIFVGDKEQIISKIYCPNCNSKDFRLNLFTTTDYDVSI